MMCANAAMMRCRCGPHDPSGPVATVLDWMPVESTPWEANAAFKSDPGRWRATLYIDDGPADAWAS